jgi:GT2 family glycosyltransferase
MSHEATTPRVTLLLPNRNNAPVLDLVLARLATNTQYEDFELLVVDDGSTDDSLGILRRWRDSERFPELRLIERPHGGAVEALNAGLAEAAGELVVQLDGDASIETEGWLRNMVDFFLSDGAVGVVTGKIVFDWGEIHTCGVDVVGSMGFHDRGAAITEPVGRRTYHQRVQRFREDDCTACDSIAEVDGGIGCCMMYRRDVALEVGGYDKRWAPVWFDDLDLTMCIRRHGLKVFYLPEVRVVHHVGRRIADEAIARRVAITTRRRIGATLPANLRRRISQRLGLDLPPRQIWARLKHHYAYWQEKWGFDMLNPDMPAVLERWGGTEVCWRYDPELRDAGERIVAAYQADRSAAQGPP